MAESEKSEFAKVEQLRPGATGLVLKVKVVDSKIVFQKGRSDSRQTRMAECLVGDETAMIVFVARGEQVDVMKNGATVILRNAKIDMFKGSMRLAVGRPGHIEVIDSEDIDVNKDNNLSLIEFDLISVVEG
eukprot:TRINITY_DN5829_c0_g1_i1.p1 TRINITY_DN5829_c0_g1~~TRINITY_DN5829_c0_g1_i1.p1  ORF type:complete len:147 (+),score=26.29 TRINITY_DN5829_c0_g1_i1:51-443(+)